MIDIFSNESSLSGTVLNRLKFIIFICMILIVVNSTSFLLLLQLVALNHRLRKHHNDSVKLIKQGIAFYESALPVMLRGDITADELYRSTGWTEEHYENFKRRLKQEQERADFRRKFKVDQLAHKHIEIIEQLKNSLR